MHDKSAEAITSRAGDTPVAGDSGARPVLWTLLLFYAAYVGAGTLCNGLSLIPNVSIIFWPPVGILIATLLLNPRSSWPWWIGVGCAAELTCNAFLWHNPLQYAFIYYAGNALEALVAAYMVGRFAPKPFRFETIEQVTTFVVCGAGLAPIVSATVIATVDALLDKHPFAVAWPLVWLGDSTGMLVSAPLTFVAVQTWRDRQYIGRAKFAEAAVVFAFLLLVGGFSLTGTLPTAYLVMPPLLWIALRFRLKGTAVALGLLTLMTGSFTVAGLGPFASPLYSPESNLVRFHIFLAVTAVSALFVAVLSQQRLNALTELEAANRELANRVAEQSGALSAKEDRLRLATQSARVGTWEIDLTTGLGSWSPEAVALFGTDRSNFDAADWVDAAHPDDRARIGEAWNRAVSHDAPYEVEFRTASPAPDGGDRWLLSRGKVDRDSSGKPIRGAGVLLDVTELRRVRTELVERSDQMRLITDAMPALISYIDIDRRYQFINVEYENWFGVDRDQTLGKTISEVLGEDAQANVEPYLQRVYAGEDVRFESRIHYQKAGWKWVEAHYLPDFAEDGSVRGFFGLVLDITEQKELQDRTREQFEELESIYEAVPVGLAVIDRDLRYVRVNQWLAEMNGLPAREHAGKPVSEVVPSIAEKAGAVLRKVMETGEPVRDLVLEGETAAQPTVARAWSEIWTPVKNAAGETVAVSVVVDDVTERRWAEELLGEQNRLLELIAAGRPLDAVLTELTRVIAKLEPRTRSAVMVADEDRRRFEVTLSSNFPESVIAKFGDASIDSVEGNTCARAVISGRPVTCTDVSSDGMVAGDWRELYEREGIAACHSEPVLDSGGGAVGSLMLAFDTPREPGSRALRLASFGAYVAGIAIERSRFEQALAASVDRYRVLFDSMDQGYCIIEMIFDEGGRPVDYLFLEVNSAFARQAGMEDVVGKRMLEFVPEIESHWLTNYGTVAKTGVPVRFANEYKGLNKWFDVYAFRPATWEGPRIAVLFTDITERKRAESEIAAAAVRDEYRITLADTLRGLDDPEEVKKAAAHLLGERLGVNRAFYAEVRENDWMVVKGFESNVQPIPDGPYSSEDFGEWIMNTYRRGEHLVFSDSGSDPRFSESERSAHASINVIGAVGVPLVRSGKLLGILAVHTAERRDWTSDEIALVEETAERTWDAVERVRAEAALRESEGRLRMATEAARIYSWEIDVPAQKLHWGPNAADVLGFRPETLKEDLTDVFSLVHPDDVEMARAVVETAVEGSGSFQIEFRMINPQTGEAVWTSSQAVVIQDQGAARIIGISQNITERKRAEAALRESEERQAFLLQLSDELRPLADPQAIQLAAGSALGRHLGASRAYYVEVEPDGEHVVCEADYTDGVPSAAGRHRLDAFGPTLKRDYEEGKMLVIDDTFADERIPAELRNAWASIGIRAQIGVPLVKEGRFVAALGVDQNFPRRWTDQELTLVREVAERTWSAVERARTEVQLRESEARFRNMADNAPVMIWVTDADGYCTYLSHSWYDYTGQTPETGLGFGWINATHPDDAKIAEEAFLTANARCEPFRVEYRLRDKDGGYRWAIDSAQPRFSDGGVFLGYVGSVIDIHERKMSEVRRLALVDLSDRFRDLDDPADIAYAASEVLGRTLGVSRVGYGTIDKEAETITIERDWNAPGICSLAGILNFRDYGSYIEELKRGETVVFADAEKDPRTRANAGALKAISAQSVVNMPVTEHGGFVALLYLNHETAREWPDDELAFIRDVAERTRIAVERRRADKALRQTQERFDIVRDGAEVGFWFCDLPFDELIWDNRVKEHFWLPADATVTIDTFYEYIHPDDRERTRAAIAESIASRNQYDIEYRTVDPASGREKWINAIGRTFYNEQGEPIRFDGVTLDVTEHKLAEAALRESEQFARQLAEVAPNILYIYDLDERRNVWGNREMTTLLGYPRERIDELAGNLIATLMHPDDRGPYELHIRRILRLADDEAAEFEYRMQAVDGSWRWLVSRDMVFRRREDGSPSQIVGAAIDVTERKEAENALREQTELLRAITESTPDLIFAKDASGRLIMANKATLDVIGQTEETAIGRLDSELYDPLEADLIMANDRRVMQLGRTETMEEVVTTGRDTRTYLTTKNPLRNGDGRIVGLVGVSHDITALKRVETALRESETRQRLALEAGHMGTWTWPMKGRDCYADERTLALFDIPPNEWNGDAALLNGRRHPDDTEAVDRSVAKAIAERTTWKGEFRIVKRDGGIRWLSAIGRLEFDRHGEPVLMRGISFDITERKQAEEELRSYHLVLEETVRERTRELAETNKELENENRERRLVEEERQRLLAQLVAAQEEERRRIAQDLHDQLGQQLTALNLKLEAALQSATDAPSTAEHLREAKTMMRRIDEDVDELAWQLRPAILDDDGFLPALRRYVEDWSRRFEVPAEFWADDFLETGGALTDETETNLYRITQEALNNIAKYAQASQVEVLLKRRGETAVLMVQDDGAGFDPGAAANGNSKRMGLIGMRERAGLVGGTFQIETAPSEGTTIYVQVPIVSAGSANGSGMTGVAGS